MARKKYPGWSTRGALDGSVACATAIEQNMPGVVVNKPPTPGIDGSPVRRRGSEEEARPQVLQVQDEGEIIKDYSRSQAHTVPRRTSSMNGRMTERSTSPDQHQQDREGSGHHASEDTDTQPRKRDNVRRAQGEIDVLYENQRGFFLCGIPLFSSKSLLNFDPSPWQTRDLKHSAMSILDKQCPDPSWEWAWKTWYVDMTIDVDDQGWMYSFSFNNQFSWHGTHVWFHSFVRRRRWLRKRVKARWGKALDDYEVEPHGFHDYFTIHSQLRHHEGYVDEEEQDYDEEINNVPHLMAALRKCTLDRHKIWAIARFVEEGGLEVMYLAGLMSKLMSSLIFQASKRQLLVVLDAEYYKAEQEYTRKYESWEDQQTSPQSTPPSGQVAPPVEPPSNHLEQKSQEERRLEALKAAVKAADQEVKQLEFWSDIKDVVVPGESEQVWGEPENKGLGRVDSGQLEKVEDGRKDNGGGINGTWTGGRGVRLDKGKGKA